MKKLLIILFSLALISGCSVNDDTQTILNQALAMPPAPGTNHSKGMVKYYLGPDMGLRASTQTSSLIMIDQTEVMMSLKVSQIVSDFYKEDAIRSMVEYAQGDSIEGVYLDQNDQQQHFVYNELMIDDELAISLDNGAISLVTLIHPAQKNSMIPALMGILRSTDVHDDLVVAKFSNKEIIKYDTIHREFFEQEVPESGSLIDMYNQMNPDNKIETEFEDGMDEAESEQ